MKIKPEYIGDWRITEMSTWDQDFIDLVAPGHLALNRNGTGSIAFDAVEAEIDCRIEGSAAQERLAFSFTGFDESTFKAEKKKAK